MGGNKWREYTMGPTLDVSMGLRGGIGGRLRVGVALVCDVRMTMSPALEIFMGTTIVFGYSLVEGTHNGNNMGANEYNIMERKKGGEYGPMWGVGLY